MSSLQESGIIFYGLFMLTLLPVPAPGADDPTPSERKRAEILNRAANMMEDYEAWITSPGPKHPASVALIDGLTEQYLVDAMTELHRIPDREFLRKMMLFIGLVVPTETKKQYQTWAFLMVELQNFDQSLNKEIDAALKEAGRPTFDEHFEIHVKRKRQAK